jgi:hypothetical protein
MALGGSQTTTVKLPKPLEQAAKENLALADQVGRIPYMPYGGNTVAGFSAPQVAAMQGNDLAAAAFGLPQGGVGTLGGQPADRPASPMAFYEQALAALTPEQRALIMSFMTAGLPAMGGGMTPGMPGTEAPLPYNEQRRPGWGS